jgi:hypothetical protein
VSGVVLVSLYNIFCKCALWSQLVFVFFVFCAVENASNCDLHQPQAFRNIAFRSARFIHSNLEIFSMAANIGSTNRVNIPAICRIKGRGTGFLISPGILLTSTHAVGSKGDAAKLSAVFFEGSKKAPVEVKLLPQQLYFAATYPEYLDYCIVACETQGIFNVTPVKLPLVKTEWPTVREGDTVLIVQHPVQEDDDPSLGSQEEVKRFEEVLRRRDDILYLKAAGTARTAGCPVFNDQAELVGLQSQIRADGEGVVNRVVAIPTIVKHLFANGQLARVEQSPTFQDIWNTWYVPNDTTRIVSIMANFKQRHILRQAAEQLCEHTTKRELLEGVVACGGTKVILTSIQQFKEDEELAVLGLRALWNISFGEDDNRHHIVDAHGVQVVLQMMIAFPNNGDIAQFGVVVLFNLTLSRDVRVSDWGQQAIAVVVAALRVFESTEVLQKFGVGFLVNVCQRDPALCSVVVQPAAMDHIVNIAQTRQSNVFIMENIISLVAVVASHTTSPSLGPLITPIVDTMLKHTSNNTILLSGNRALWGLGNDPFHRIKILEHPDSSRALQASLNTLIASTKSL